MQNYGSLRIGVCSGCSSVCVTHSCATDRHAFDTALSVSLTESIHTILTHTSSERGRAAVPLITNASGISPFPVRMAVRVGAIEVSGN